MNEPTFDAGKFIDYVWALREQVEQLRAELKKAKKEPWRLADTCLPPVARRLDQPCELQGEEIPPLNESEVLQLCDGRRVYAGRLSWFDGGKPIGPAIYWKPLSSPPGAKE